MKAKREFVVLPEDDVKPTLTEWLEGESKIELKDNRYVQAYKQALSDIEDKIKAGEFSGL